jgi:Kef-type K+ transport system membrane component KefB
MKRVALFSVLLVLGLAGSQLLPGMLGEAHAAVAEVIQFLTLAALAFIMIHVGLEFEIDKSNPRRYGWDYVVAMTAAAFPWIFVTLYFLYVILPADAWSSWQAWKEALLAGRFAAPTSAGVLFSMLAAAGLASTWLYRKARILAIFDDLDTVLLMIPLKMLMVGIAWQLGLIVLLMAGMLWIAWRYLHRWAIPSTWPWVLGYATAIAAVCEAIYLGSRSIDHQVPIHIEVLLPAFVLGCVMRRPEGAGAHDHDPGEQRASTVISASFMVLVGLSMPAVAGAAGGGPDMGWGEIALHVLAITVISNLGKMFPAFCYRREAHWKERLAVAIGMWPRGEVGAGVLIISLGYGIGGAMVTVAMLSLAVNLLLTGVFIWIVKRLITSVPAQAVPSSIPDSFGEAEGSVRQNEREPCTSGA